ncbi:HNH endonuclease [Rhodobacter sp. SY28-1]|uniref:HNH endonuclease n=1 Tax=Rhodobacter sp. SY28-1 TaxID=2562317 RepID=UPI0010C08E85|nr:HNH endonuclease signature motif containing protein [Rhodobacter sp. SY28-1]
MRLSIKEPVPQLFEAWELLSQAADAHLSGELKSAEALIHEANNPALWAWLYPEWEKCHLNVIDKLPHGDTTPVPKSERDTKRFLTSSDKVALLKRDGYRCRYCGCPVISPEVRKLICRLYPAAAPWDENSPTNRHMGLQALWLQFDHVVPYSHGGCSDVQNSVVSCALCNFGKDKYTLLQLGLEDPRLREVVQVNWDGLNRLLAVATPPTKLKFPTPTGSLTVNPVRPIGTYFIPGAHISAGYLFTPPIAGKERWFKLGPEVEATQADRRGAVGCVLKCAPNLLIRRGLSPDQFADVP